MSDEIESGAGGAGSGISEGLQMCFRVEVKCPRPVYRRAGIAFSRGKAILENVSADQLAILRADRVLSVSHVSETPVQADKTPGRLDAVDVGDLNARILAAVAKLDSGNAEHFTRAGVPRVAAVSEVLGETVTAAQLKTALEAKQA